MAKPEQFKCPTCAAPLSFSGDRLVSCGYCGGTIVVPESIGNREPSPEEKAAKVKAVLEAFFSTPMEGNYVVDLRGENSKADLAEVVSEIRSGHEDAAVRIFSTKVSGDRETAAKILRAIENGDSIDLTNARVGKQIDPGDLKKYLRWLIIAMIAVTVIPAVIGIIAGIIGVIISIVAAMG